MLCIKTFPLISYDPSCLGLQPNTDSACGQISYEPKSYSASQETRRFITVSTTAWPYPEPDNLVHTHPMRLGSLLILPSGAVQDLRRLVPDFHQRQPRLNPRSCRICSGQSDTGVCFFRVLRFPLPILISTHSPYIVSIMTAPLNNKLKKTAIHLRLTFGNGLFLRFPDETFVYTSNLPKSYTCT
jgi:hypothetical protein